MPIVINEFEVVVEPPPSATRANGAESASQTEQTPGPRPDEIVTVMQVHQDRIQRVRAD